MGSNAVAYGEGVGELRNSAIRNQKPNIISARYETDEELTFKNIARLFRFARKFIEACDSGVRATVGAGRSAQGIQAYEHILMTAVGGSCKAVAGYRKNRKDKEEIKTNF